MACSINKILDFLTIVGRLKHIRRTGWVYRGVKDPESVASHMYRMGIMSFLLDTAEQKVDKTHCMKMALVHDLAESIVGDITPDDGVSDEHKHNLEKDAMKNLSSLVPESVAKELSQLWMEYEKQETYESHVVKDLDRFDMLLQAYEYEKTDQRPLELEEFFLSTRGSFKTEQIKKWMEELENQRTNSISQ